MARPVIVNATGGKEGTVKCLWTKCDEKHEFDIKYPNDGIVERKALGEWSHPSSFGYKEYKTNITDTTSTTYTKRKHHVIPVNVYEKLPTISANLKVLGYDINDEGYNGLALPFRTQDLAFHDLQFHRGSHPVYDGNVERAIGDLESKCETFCKTGNQVSLWDSIEKFVKGFKQEIITWQWPLHSYSETQRGIENTDHRI